MSSTKEFSPEQIEEIVVLRGKESAASIRKRFAIGSTSLYKIWKEAAEENVIIKMMPTKTLLSQPNKRHYHHAQTGVWDGTLATKNRRFSQRTRKPF